MKIMIPTITLNQSLLKTIIPIVLHYHIITMVVIVQFVTEFDARGVDYLGDIITNTVI